ncbi:TPA: hypothetical protein N0F65_004610 [Lagenidium giganteum]|uniref:RING-type E3 ubiquitin transferase n=1 Tax=Lagenidium giganteum TaxID=4803 RepID=A0AAV2ZDU6_9STRA|nr:TPA: hypothetical protein N0F65_004610 [Lagenidium giganteum]
MVMAERTRHKPIPQGATAMSDAAFGAVPPPLPPPLPPTPPPPPPMQPPKTDSPGRKPRSNMPRKKQQNGRENAAAGAGNGAGAAAAPATNGSNSSNSKSPERTPRNNTSPMARPARKSARTRTNAGARKPKASAKDATATEEQEDEREMCVLCADPIDFYAVGECNHHGICSKCSMRMRLIMNDRSCPICKKDLDNVVVSATPEPFQSFQLWGDFLGADSVKDEASSMIFYQCRRDYDELLRLRGMGCRVKKCKEEFQNLAQMKEHLKRQHALELCDLCVEFQNMFLQEHHVYTKGSLHAHNIGKQRGIGPKGKDFHPMCRFCKNRFYSDMELYQHLERDHFHCHICKVEHQYFRNYASLETHFRKQHYFLASRFVVFSNDIDYHAHMTANHGVHNRLMVNFQVARSAAGPFQNGAIATVADDVPDSWNCDVEELTPATPMQEAFPALPVASAPAAPAPTAPAIARASSAPRTTNPSIRAVPNVRQEQVMRNQRLAQALGLARGGMGNNSVQAFEEEMKTPSYPPELVEWGKLNSSYLHTVERRLERVIGEASCYSVSLRPMPADERRLMHMLAEFYGVASESYDEEPRRRLSFFKRDDARVPYVTLSQFIRNSAKRPPQRAAPAQRQAPGPVPAPAAAPRPATGGVSRGWEKIEKKQRPVIADAWSDDEDESNEAQAASAEEQLPATAPPPFTVMQLVVTASTLLVLASGASAEDRCTAIIVGAAASTNNAPMTTHTADCSSCDFRIAKVPAQRFNAVDEREITLVELDYPRYVGKARGSVYYRENLDTRFYNWTDSTVLGTIPQVESTYAYIDGAYGIINEHQVAIGESTCSSRFVAIPKGLGGDALFDVSELTRLAMERTTSARAAIQLMGDLAVKHGFYNGGWEADDAESESGEALTVTDPKEAWVFHILPDDTGKSAVWAAQRVPDNHISGVANRFVLHEIDLTDKENFMASDNIYHVAIRNNFWKPEDDKPFDFTDVYAAPSNSTTPAYYATRRIWRLFTLANPDLKLSPNERAYPFSVEVARPLSPQDIMRFQRDHYEGTEFDLTNGPAGGPYGNPERYDPGTNDELTRQELQRGRFERTISIFRASYSFVSVLDPANSDNGLIWFGQYAPHATSYTPVYAKVTEVPTVLATGSLFAFNRSSSFWMHAIVGNWASRFYKYAHPYVETMQTQLEDAGIKAQTAVQQQAAQIKQSKGEDEMVQFLTRQSDEAATRTHDKFAQLFETLVTVFHDGYRMTNFDGDRIRANPLFYPKWWLEQVGFLATADNDTASSAAESTANAAPFAEVSTKATPDTESAADPSMLSIAWLVGVGIVSIGAGIVIGRRSAISVWSLVVGGLALAAAPAIAEDRCTAMIVGPKGSTNGAPMATQTNDCSSCDFRIAKVPAQTHEEGAVREIALAAFDYPRYVGSARGSVYLKENLDPRLAGRWNNSVPIGSIPQVRETYAYIDGVYGIINEHQLAFGESTCGGRFWAKPISQGGDALFDIAELSRVALERTKTARDAIQLMGDLAVQYGYYGASWEGDGVYDEAGEALMVTDPKEAWVFHILPDDTGKSAIWVAQRVPDNHISAVGNKFVIHDVNLEDPDNFLGSDNLYDIAIKHDLWQPDSDVAFDFTAIYAAPSNNDHPDYYATRRVWRVFSLANPGLNLSPDEFAYPFSVEVAKPLTPKDIMRFQRDHYEGTQFDMTKGLDAGPYGNPDRYDSVSADLTGADVRKGRFERAISIFRASYSYVTVLDRTSEDNALVWFGQYAPHATAYTPVFAKVSEVPQPLATGSLFAYDQNSSFWIHAVVGNWASRFYKYAHPFVVQAQCDLEDHATSVLDEIRVEAAYIKRKKGVDDMVKFLTKQSTRAAEKAHKRFTKLIETLVTVFHDGYQMQQLDKPELKVVKLFYPTWWLQLVGYYGTSAASVALSATAQMNEAAMPTVARSVTENIEVSSASTVFVAIVALAIGAVGGLVAGRRTAPAPAPRRHLQSAGYAVPYGTA